MFDTFEPFQGLQKIDFDFTPSRYEMWIGGEMVKNGRTYQPIQARVMHEAGEEKVRIDFSDAALQGELASSNVFDEFITSKDRLQLITIPKETNVQNMGIMMFNMTVGSTRQEKNFSRNEPYCCNLFLQQGRIAKITFSYSNPEKLLEFYS